QKHTDLSIAKNTASCVLHPLQNISSPCARSGRLGFQGSPQSESVWDSPFKFARRRSPPPPAHPRRPPFLSRSSQSAYFRWLVRDYSRCRSKLRRER
uniref:Uncharacterized protein n=3 Tax=Aegilops tauschii subsp. strangulata TaxID=200361 RepID=A0A453K0K6_AEGTS